LTDQKIVFIQLNFFDIYSQHKEPINSRLFYLELIGMKKNKKHTFSQNVAYLGKMYLIN